jgi:hypothetical protein
MAGEADGLLGDGTLSRSGDGPAVSGCRSAAEGDGEQEQGEPDGEEDEEKHDDQKH